MSYSATIQALSGLRGYWRCGQTSAASGVADAILDASGQGNHGTTFGSPAVGFATTGALSGDADTAMTFAKTNGVAVTNTAPFAFTCADAFCGGCWFKRTAGTPNDPMLMGKLASAAPFSGWDLITQTVGTNTMKVRFRLNNSGSKGAYWDGTLPGNGNTPNIQIQGGEWAFVAWQYIGRSSGSFAAADVKLWYNGVPMAVALTNAGSMTPSDSIATSNTFQFGQVGSVNYGLTGAMDEVFVGAGNVLTDAALRGLFLDALGTLTKRSRAKVVLVSDVEQDVDSYVGEWCAGLALDRRGDIDLIGGAIDTAVGSTPANNYEAAAVDAARRYYGRGPSDARPFPFGQNTGTSPSYAATYSDDVSGAFTHTVDSSNVPEAVATLRSLLGASANGSVTLVGMGGATVMSALLASTDTGDGYGPGSRLIYDKVARTVWGAGGYEDHTTYRDSTAIPATAGTTNAEFDMGQNVTASANVCANWPTRIEFTDYRFGVNSSLPGTGMVTDAASPANKAYAIAGAAGRNTWGVPIWLHVVYNESGSGPGTTGTLFATSAAGTNVVNTATNTPNTGPAGYNKFTYGNTRSVSVSGVGTVTLSDVAVTQAHAVQLGAFGMELLTALPTPGDRTAPTFVSGSVGEDGQQVFLTFSEALTGTALAGFTIKQNGVAVIANGIVDGDEIAFDTVQIYAGRSVTVEYDAAAGNLTDAAGNPLASFGPVALTNGSTVPAPGGSAGAIRIDISIGL